MTIKSVIQEFITEIEIRKYTPKTIRTYKNSLNLFLRFCEEKAQITEIQNVTMATVRQYTSSLLSKGCKGTYINGLLKSLKSFLQYCFDEGYNTFDTKKNFKWVKEEKTIIRAFSTEQVQQIMKSCKGNDFISVRDNAILTILFETGIRCWELCCIKKEDIHEDFIIINGKNHKQRVVPITPMLFKALSRYERSFERYFYLKNIDNYYFLSFHGKQLTNGAVENIVKKYGEGIHDVRVSPHTCRHFFAQQQIKMGTDLYTISRLLGHENIQITQVYLNSLRDEDIIKIAKQNSVLMSL